MCLVCHQLFKNPKYLPCYHSCCKECLEKIKEGSKIICPECRKEIVIPDGGVKNLPNNYLLNHLVNKVILNYKLEHKTDLRCEGCDEDDPVFGFCTNCKSFFCYFCQEFHKYSKSHRSHNLIMLSELKSNKDLVQSSSKFPTCQEHELELEYYCETCERLVCVQCTAEHEDHRYDVVKKVADRYHNEMNKVTASMDAMIEDLSKTYDEIDRMRTTIRQKGEKIYEEIDLYYEEAYQKLLKQKEEVKNQVRDTVLQKVEAVTIQLKEVMDTQARVLSTKRMSDDLQEDTGQEFLSIKDHLVSTMKILTERCKEIESANVRIVPSAEPVPQIVKHFTTIDSLSFEVKSLDSDIQQDQMALIEIITKDSKGDLYSKGGCEVTVELEPMTKGVISVETTDNNDGTYLICCMAQEVRESCEIKLSVFLNGHEIKDSPVTIKASKPNKTITRDGIACNNNGMWALADCSKNCVRVFDCQDRLIKKFGSQGRRNGQFKYPCGVAFDNQNFLYVTDCHNHRVQKFDPHGKYLLEFGRKGTAEGHLNYPTGIITHQDKVYVADRGNHRISVFQNDGKFFAVIGQHHMSRCFDIAVNINNSELLVADWGHHCIYTFSIDGYYINDMTLRVEDDTLELKKPCSITTDADDSILISGLDDHCVSIFDETGEQICCFGSEGSKSDHSHHGIAVGPDGTLYVSDTVNRGVKIFPFHDDNLNLMHAYFVDYHGRYKLPLDL